MAEVEIKLEGDSRREGLLSVHEGYLEFKYLEKWIKNTGQDSIKINKVQCIC